MNDPAPDPVAFEAAAGRFQNFFRELNETFVEREDVLQQIALALLSREHVLMTGPPGTAKSQLASAVLRRIVDERTGQPSVFSRQFTESTVQTDLVGPIDFKTLVESGRTRHFTDEGMLGAVHAFLDEVFDGRDMLLRAALNVLQEREFKQGTQTTAGRIECSLMTSNRYLADVLESSRPTLLAFVDRIAFNAFVPRGFAERGNLAAVLRRHVGSSGGPVLRASLSIQDLDVLQAAVDAVEVDDVVCDAIGVLLELLDVEMSEAVRADAAFVPTRYLSTRTAVRCGRVLRGITVADKIADPELTLVARHRHLASLRLHLLLSGPTPEAIGTLLERETDPNERRQLAIVRTEREVFERVWKKIADLPQSEATAGRDFGSVLAEIDRLEAELPNAIGAGPEAVAALLTRLSPLSRASSRAAVRASALAARATAALDRCALRASLEVRGAPPGTAFGGAAKLAELADAIDDATESTRPAARWLRGQALALLDEAAARLTLSTPDGDEAGARAERRLSALEQLGGLRLSLGAKGAERPAKQAADEPIGSTWLRAIGRGEDELALMFDEALRTSISAHLTAKDLGVLGRLSALAPEVERLDAAERRLAALRATEPRLDAPDTIKSRVLGRHIGVLVKTAFADVRSTDREAIVREIKEVFALLDRSGLRSSIAATDAAAWAAAAIACSEREGPVARGTLDYDGYRALRKSDQRLSTVYALADVAVDLIATSAPTSPVAPRSPEAGLTRIRELLATVPAPLRESAVRHDLERIDRALGYLERWWSDLAAIEGDVAEKVDAIVRSKFFHVVLEESALVRFSFEAELVLDLFPELAGRVPEVVARATALEDRAREAILDLVKQRAEAGWRQPAGAT